MLHLVSLLAMLPLIEKANDALPRERTCFQTSSGYRDSIDLQTDVAIVYGIDKKLPDRIKSWQAKGYRTHVMTGVSWGEYQDYLYGRYDGINHEDEAQVRQDGEKVGHGGDVYYMCPGINYGKFLSVGVQRALDAGAEAIHLEEPEFWVKSGYEEGFKREWKDYYHEAWQAPHESPDAQWRASKLKYYLYRRALQQVFDHVHEFNAKTGKQVKCYVPTHSLINYAQWSIVSPESSLARLQGCDGYIAQVWTGTSRTENVYQGKKKDRTFEAAFLEYGAMQNMVRATGRRVWFLNDPIEDNPGYDWNDYRVHWESTLTASLLQPEVNHYEVMPWPERIFEGTYPQGRPNAQPLPKSYGTELLNVCDALGDIDTTPVSWEAGTSGVGVVISDSLMFQRSGPGSSDGDLSHVFGLTMPLVKRGLPVQPIQLENMGIDGYLKGVHTLVMTYQGMKPLTREIHTSVADWVKHGGTLIFVDDDTDKFNAVRDWWNAAPLSYKTPREDLFLKLGVGADELDGTYPVGRGKLVVLRQNPVHVAYDAALSNQYVETVSAAVKANHKEWKEVNHLILRRGRYVVAAGLDESISAEPYTLKGNYVDLFDPALAVRTEVNVVPGTRHFLLDLSKISGKTNKVLVGSCRPRLTTQTGQALTVDVEGPANTNAVVLMKVKSKPTTVKLGDQAVDWKFDNDRNLLWVNFGNEPKKRTLTISLK